MPQIPVYHPGQTGGMINTGGGLSYAPGGGSGVDVTPVVQAAHAINTAIGMYAQAQRQLTAEDQKLDLQLQLNRMKNEFGQTEADLRAKQLDPATATRPDQYPSLVEQALQQHVQQGMANLKYPEMSRQFMIHALPWITQEQAKARNNAIHIGIIQAQGAANILDQEDITAASLAPDDATRQAAFKRLADRDLTRTNMGLESKMASHLAEIDSGTARRMWQDPNQRLQVAAMLSDGKFRYMTPQAQLTLRDHLMTQDRVEQEHAQALLEKEMTKYREDATTTLMSDALQRKAPPQVLLQRLDEVRRNFRGSMKDTEYERLYKIIMDPDKDTPSDPDVLARVTRDVASMYPKMSEAQLGQLNDAWRRGEPGLSNKDYARMLEHRTSAVRHNQEHGESIAMREHAQAEQELRNLLGIPAIYDKLEGNKEKVWGLGLQMLRRRSYAYPTTGGTENPLKVLEEIGPRLVGMLGSDARLETTKLKGLINTYGNYQTPADVESAYKAGQINQGQRDNLKKFFMEMDSQQQELDRINAELQKSKAKQPQKSGTKRRTGPAE